MGAKRALIVDDSKSARMFLSRILEKYELEVDSVESAENAIEYLGHHRPDVIFMDHMMPGMDGFQAVQAIKNNPRTAMIPIMMYTSQEGELYLGQARALGAIGVLPKQIKPADVSKVLYQLHLVADRRTGEQSTFKQFGLEAVDNGSSGTTAPIAKLLTDTALREQFADLRRALVASIDTQSERITADVRTLLQDAIGDLAMPTAAKPERPWAWVIASIALLVALASTGLWWREANLRQGLIAQLAEPQLTELQRNSAAVQAAARRAPRALAPGAPAATALDQPGSRATSGASEGAVPGTSRASRAPASTAIAATDAKPIIAPVPYGDDPLGGPRLEMLRQLLGRLAAEHFRGIVDIRTFPGRFCLVGNASEGFSLAPEESLFAHCDIVGNPREETLQPTQRESLGFANLVGGFRSSTRGALDIQVSPGDAAATLTPYPQISGTLTAGDWNRAANANNRIEIRLR